MHWWGGHHTCWELLLTAIISRFSRQLLEINWALHYIPFIFYLSLTSSTSFGWILISGDVCQKWKKLLGANPGRPASPRLPQERGYVFNPRAKWHPQYLWVVDWTSIWSNEPTGFYMDQRTHNSVQHWEQLMIQHPRAITSIGLRRRWNRWPACARERPASLALSALKLRKWSPTLGEDPSHLGEGRCKMAWSLGRPA